MIRFWTDGCCLKNPGGPGGWAWVMEEKGVVLNSRSGGVPSSTNNKMELMAAIEALRFSAPRMVESKLEIVSDSLYVVQGINLWMESWKKKGWRRGKQPVKNVGLWKELDALRRQVPTRVVQFRWVKGHSGANFNEMADELAGLAAKAHA